METSLKTGFAQIFSCCPKNLSCPKFGGAAAPLAPPARTPVLVWEFIESSIKRLKCTKTAMKVSKPHKELCLCCFLTVFCPINAILASFYDLVSHLLRKRQGIQNCAVLGFPKKKLQKLPSFHSNP